jgi:dynein heavy chain
MLFLLFYFRVLQLIQEAKWLIRLGIQIPESAQTILRQEGRFKNYKDHLELCLKEFDAVCNSIPECFVELFVNHIEAVEMNLHPGLSTLAWNSMNIGKNSFRILYFSFKLHTKF